MNSHRDDVEALAGVAGLLLEARDPGELADRFLAHVMRLFPSDAGLFYVPGKEPPRMSVVGLEPREAYRLAAELYDDLGGAGDTVRRVDRRGAARRWPQVVAVVVGIEADRRGLVALFSTRPDAYDPDRDGRLLRHMARHATSAVTRARAHRRSREEAERFALQAEEIERIRRALERHSRELEWSLAARGRFFALMSHELRTPLNAILGYIDLLDQGVLGRLTPRQTEAVGKVATSARHLLALVNDVLDLSKLEAGRLVIEREPVDLVALAGDAVAAVELEGRRKGLDLYVRCHDALPRVHSDGGRVRQILLNLLSNAVKFTETGSVSIEVRHLSREAPSPTCAAPPCRAGEDGWVGITVEDTGPGIPAAELEAIFGEYVQLGTGPHGTGLGLAISRRLARLLGGELVADSQVGVRSTFVLYLPCPTPIVEAAPDVAPAIPAPGASDRRM